MACAMKASLRDIFRKLGPWSISSSSQVFVSVSVVNTMPLSRQHQRSTRVIIKVSIWTCLILVFSFLLIYTILLICVDQQLQPVPFELPYKRIRLLGRLNNNNRKAHIENNMPKEQVAAHRKVIWNSSLYFDDKEFFPHCKSQTFLTVLVTSSPEHADRRLAIRNSWCNPKLFSAPELAWRCIFLVGDSSSDDNNSLLKNETASYNDILLGSYVDSYRNLTLKVIHGLTWSSHYCPSSYVVKTDDDCFVNARLLHEFLVNYNSVTNGLYAGNVLVDRHKLKVIRDPENRWSVRFEDYPQEYYPPYASGIGYVLSADIVKQLVSESMYIFPIPNEDAYIGIVISHLGISPERSNRFVLSSSGLSVCNFLYVFIVHNVKADVQKELMIKANKSKTECNYIAITTWR